MDNVLAKCPIAKFTKVALSSLPDRLLQIFSWGTCSHYRQGISLRNRSHPHSLLALGRAYEMQTLENPILSLTKHSKLHILAALMLSHALARCTFNGATQSLSLSKNMSMVCRWRDQPVISHCTRDKADLALEDEVYRTTLEIERSQD